MLFAITVANLAGSLIPMLMDRLGFDPAVASGPFITTLSDLTSVLIYFNIASLFMGYFKNKNICNKHYACCKCFCYKIITEDPRFWFRVLRLRSIL